MNLNFKSLVVVIIFFGCQSKQDEIYLEKGSVMDVEGNVYSTVKIGNVWWMAENLRSTRYSDSTIILEFSELDTPLDSASVLAFYVDADENGFLYNFQAVVSNHGLAPPGWRIATDDDWRALENVIGMDNETNQKWGWRGSEQAKSICRGGNQDWKGELMESNNKFGLTILPTGCALPDGRINKDRNSACFWTSTAANNSQAIYRLFDENQKRIFRQKINMGLAMGIRCVKI